MFRPASRASGHGERTGPAGSLPSMRWLGGAVLDAAVVLLFVAIGRSAHHHGLTIAGMARTSWPFLASAAAGWLLARGWRRPDARLGVGVVVWLSCVALGMVLRVVAGQGTAAAFIGVALVFLGIGLLGWRALAYLVHGSVRRRRLTGRTVTR
jgi:FtsH-binding integral membrane protein